jgi:hypothetical protein
MLYEFKNPVIIKDLRDNDAYFRDWGAYSGNFQRNSFEIPLKYWEKLNQIALEKNPEYAKIYGQISNKESLEAENNLQLGFETILSKYIDVSIREPFGKQNETWAAFDALHKNLLDSDAIRKYPNLNVLWSVGQGNWSKIPWIAFLDPRETNTIQRGTYVVFLFREDMSGVYLTLAQGVTKLKEEMTTSEARFQLRKKATELRGDLKELLGQGFLLDDHIDLHTEKSLGTNYEYSTIAYKLYKTGSIPNDEILRKDLDALLFAYNRYLGGDKMTKIDQLKNLLESKPQIILAGPAWHFENVHGFSAYCSAWRQ